MSKDLRIAFIGAGDIAPMHAEAIAKAPGASLAGLWSIDEALNREKAESFGCTVYGSVEELLADEAVDAVFVLTNLETHVDYAVPAMKAGKHVLVEKPVAATEEDLDLLAATAREQNVVLMPGHNYIYEPGIERTHELISSGRLGDLVSIYVLYNIHHPEEVARRYPGVIRHILTHHSYLLIYLAGNPTEVSALKSVVHYEEYDGEDLAMVNLKLQSGALAHFCASFAADDNASDPWTFIVKVVGTEGATRFSYRDWVENKPGPVHAHTWSAYQAGIDNEVAHFLRCVRGEAEPRSTIQDAKSAFQVVAACEASVAERRTISLE